MKQLRDSSSFMQSIACKKQYFTDIKKGLCKRDVVKISEIENKIEKQMMYLLLVNSIYRPAELVKYIMLTPSRLLCYFE